MTGIRQKRRAIVILLFLMFLALPVVAFAKDGDKKKTDTTSESSDGSGSSFVSSAGTEKVGDLADVLYDCVNGVGDILMIFGAVRFGIALTSDQAQKMSDGITALVVGVVLANIKTIMGS